MKTVRRYAPHVEPESACTVFDTTPRELEIEGTWCLCAERGPDGRHITTLIHRE